MYNSFATQLARLLTEFSVPIKPGEIVAIFAPCHTRPITEALMSAVLKRGAHPIVQLNDPHLQETFAREANDDQLQWTDPHALHLLDVIDAYIGIGAPNNLHNYGGIPEERLTLARKGNEAATKKNLALLQRKDFRWSGVVWPTDALAQQAGMGLGSFQAYAYQAFGLDQPDPVKHWETICTKQARIIEWLTGKERVTVKGPGIDVSFNISERPWANWYGQHHMPDGEIFTCPLEDSMNGTVEFAYPWFQIEGARLTFKDGVVTGASARQREERLQALLDTDEGARRVGLVGIGTNPGLTHVTNTVAFDMKIKGTIHIVLGQSMPEGGGKNTSAVQIALLTDMRPDGEIRVDGELFYRGGKFMV